MFPPAMTRQRDRLVGALVRIVTNVDQAVSWSRTCRTWDVITASSAR